MRAGQNYCKKNFAMAIIFGLILVLGFRGILVQVQHFSGVVFRGAWIVINGKKGKRSLHFHSESLKMVKR